MATRKYVSYDKLLYFWAQLKAYFARKTDLDSLSDRVDDIVTSGGEPNVINSIKVNGVTQTITNKAVDIPVPTNNNELVNGAGYQTASDVASAIATGVAGKANSATTLAGYGITDAYTKTQVDNAIGAIDAGVTSVNGDTGAVVITAASLGALTQHQDITGKADKATTLSGYGITNAYTKTEVDTAISNSVASVLKFKGSVNSYANLPTSNVTVGDTYNVLTAYNNHPAGTNWSYTENGWDALGGAIDLSGYVLNSDLVEITNAEIDTIVAS